VKAAAAGKNSVVVHASQ